jgi:hypothetical protein
MSGYETAGFFAEVGYKCAFGVANHPGSLGKGAREPGAPVLGHQHQAHRPEIDRGTELVVYAEPGLCLFHCMEAAHVLFVLPDHLVHASGAEDCCMGGRKCSPCIMGEGIGTSSQVGSYFEVDFRLIHIGKVDEFGVVGIESGIVAKLL